MVQSVQTIPRNKTDMGLSLQILPCLSKQPRKMSYQERQQPDYQASVECIIRVSFLALAVVIIYIQLINSSTEDSTTI
jgi:hypothetical protein